MTACSACGEFPCAGTHVDCDLDEYAAHRGLTVEQIVHQMLFASRREDAAQQRALKAWIAREPYTIRVEPEPPEAA